MTSNPSASLKLKKTKITDTNITLSHGSGGKAMRDLINEIFVNNFDNNLLATLEDQARFEIKDLAKIGDRLAFTTDSYVVSPLFFPGGDIGSLAVNGTVNDLAVGGAIPLYLSCSFILEEGLSIDTLKTIVTSMKIAAEKAAVKIVTGDTKVVSKGQGDQIFINTSGVGVIPAGINSGANNLQVGDRILINGFLGDHGAAILIARGELDLQCTIESACQALNSLISAILAVCPEVKAMRDATRGGLATVLTEFAQSSGVGIQVQETAIPIREEVRGMCELLGLEPLYLANEGKLVLVVPPEAENRVLAVMRSHPDGKNAASIGEVVASPPNLVYLKTAFGTKRILDMLVGEQLPRIC
ncbi:hydrogenase expression/formation protein HypE [Microcystis sp. M49636_WE2]|uniref:hydrogenase expression/formation protein HypE n=1 Tax=Microcystis sp. M49636_WE2 TaxID=3030679 RepID=UPI00258AEB9B|nr:hydrogenase expression/formation protein HypE [Microcystis sp. M49636_WE2]MDJ0583888.1 hydrogenase expression/formation protein HypE [Microcystis sp. M49636_WE2]